MRAPLAFGVAAALLGLIAPGFAQAPLGPELAVSEDPEHSQYAPKVAIGREGRLAVVWRDSTRWESSLQLLELDGDGLRGSDFRFDDHGISADWPEVEISTHGDLALTWIAALAEGGVALYGRSRLSLSTMLSPGAPWLGNDSEIRGLAPYTLGVVRNRSLAVVFTGIADGEDWADIDTFAKRVTPTGEALSPIVRLNETRLGWQFGSGVAGDGKGRLFAAWTDESQRDGSGQGVFGRILGPESQPVGPEFLVNQAAEHNQGNPDVASNVEGEFVVAWQGKEPHDVYYDVWARRYAATGEPLSDEFVVNQYDFQTQWEPAVAMDSIGNFVVAWTAPHYPLPGGSRQVIVARAYAADGTPLGGEVVVDSDLPGDDESQFPSVALSDSGLFAVAWERLLIGHPVDGDSSDVRLRRFVWPCRADSGSLCLGGRFLVRAQQETTGSDYRYARAVPLSASAGAFWFFDADNLELFVKVLDGCAVNQRYWVYAAGLTDRRVDLEVTDTWTGEVWFVQTEMLSRFPAVQDVEAFSGCGAPPPPAAATPSAEWAPGLEPARSLVAAPDPPAGDRALAADCVADERTLCLTGSRFRVTAEYRMAAGERGEGRAQPFGAESGLFWFFDSANPELFVKVLDGCELFGTYWVYAAGLTDVEVTLRVEDLESGQVRTWTNPLGTPFAPIHDAAAFATCEPGE